MLKAVIFLLFVLNLGVLCLDTTSNVEDATKSAKLTEEQKVQLTNDEPDDVNSSKDEQNLNPNAEPPQTETKNQAASSLQLTKDQIDKLADKILKAHGVEPDDDTLQNYQDAERLRKIVHKLETKIEDKLKETIEQALADNAEAIKEEKEINTESVKPEPAETDEQTEDEEFQTERIIETDEVNKQTRKLEVHNINTKESLEEDKVDDTVRDNVVNDEQKLTQNQNTENHVEAVQQPNAEDHVAAVDRKQIQNPEYHLKTTTTEEKNLESDNIKKGSTAANEEAEIKETNDKVESLKEEEKRGAEDLVEQNAVKSEDIQEFEKPISSTDEEIEVLQKDEDASENQDIKVTTADAEKREAQDLVEQNAVKSEDIQEFEEPNEAIDKEDIEVLRKGEDVAENQDIKVTTADAVEEENIDEADEEFRIIYTKVEEYEDAEPNEKYNTEDVSIENLIQKDDENKETVTVQADADNVVEENKEEGMIAEGSNKEKRENAQDTEPTDENNVQNLDNEYVIEEDDLEYEEDPVKQDDIQILQEYENDEEEIANTITDEVEVDVENEEIQIVSSETCKLEEGNCDEDSEEEQLYLKETNIKTEPEELAESNSESGFLGRIFKFLSDRF